MDSASSLNQLPTFTIVILVITMSSIGFFSVESQDEINREELATKDMPRFATSPGHTVFGEYVGAHWCGPCMSSASPSLTNLKSDNPDDFTFVSFFEGDSSGWPSDGPINRKDHVMAGSSGYPTFAFADVASGTCYKVGASGTNYYDSQFSSGGCMHADSTDFRMELSISLNGAGDTVTTTLDVTYIGSGSVQVFVYGAITEKTGAEAYSNGYKPHHVWRDWLLDSTGTGFEQITLNSNQLETLSWDTPLSKVRASGGSTQWENFWPVIALMDGPHTTWNGVYAAIDLDMGPLVDVGISQFDARNSNGNVGFIQGDIIDLEVQVMNNGAESYDEGGTISVYYLQGADEVQLGSISLNQLGISGTQSYITSFDTSDVSLSPSGASSFRARLSDLTGDRISSNDYMDDVAFHDMPPVASRPSSIGSPSIHRGIDLQFESTALSNDLVDDTSTMTTVFQYSQSDIGDWESSWITSVELVGTGGNSRYVHTISPPINAETGNYDVRIQWTDPSGQTSDWEVANNAFELRNALPTVLGSGDEGFFGVPTVKVDTVERVSIVGLISDAETPLSMITIDSNAPEFISYDSSTFELLVNFQEVALDSQGNPLTQGLFVTVDDGEDVNTGTILFNVVENGQPRWAPIPTQSFEEGSSGSLALTYFLSDSDDEGNSVPPTGLEVSIVSISDENLVRANLNGHMLNVESLDDDSFGMSEITIRASDGIKFSDTVVTYHVNNINDEPRIDISEHEEIIVQVGDRINLDILSLVTDVDDPDEEIWITVTTFVPGAVLYNPISGLVTMSWETAGEELVTITAEDRHGDASAEIITVSVVSELPLHWEDSTGNGDLSASISSVDFGSNPSVMITNIGSHELSDIEVRWSVCNSITGICNDFGVSYNFGPFIVLAADGEGLSTGDYVTLDVSSVDSNGFDRSTLISYKVFATQPSDTEFEEVGDDSKANSGNGISALTIGLSIGVILLLSVVVLLAVVLSRQRSSLVEYSHQEIDLEEPQQSPSSPLQIPPPPPGMGPPLPPEGLPPGWTMEQWNYYGESYLNRRE